MLPVEWLAISKLDSWLLVSLLFMAIPTSFLISIYCTTGAHLSALKLET